MDRDLTKEEIEGLEDLENHVGYRVILEELDSHLNDCVQGLKGAKNWEEHINWMSRIGILEEMIPLRATLLMQDLESKRMRLEEKEE